MKQTENYQLNQWELTDRIEMEDFNSDNQKIDAALKSLHDGNFKIKTGSFAGTGTTGTMQYSIGVKPKLMLIQTTNDYGGATHAVGLLLTEKICVYFDSNRGAQMYESGPTGALTEDGFSITSSVAEIGFNASGSTLYYWAVY